MNKYIFTLLLLLTLSYGQLFAQKRTVRTKLSLSENTFAIKNVASGKYLDLPGAGSNAKKDNGTNVKLWDYDSGNDRKFQFTEYNHSGYYFIRPCHCNSRLDIEGCYPGRLFCKYYKNKKGAPIQIWEYNGSTGKGVALWKLEEVKPGQFVIINKYSGLVMDASASNVHKNGCKVMIWNRNNNDNQLWELIDIKTGKRYEE
nr:RICIN domain-containing protein [uncultured Carboxylicivirga sp.]